MIIFRPTFQNIRRGKYIQNGEGIEYDEIIGLTDQ